MKIDGHEQAFEELAGQRVDEKVLEMQKQMAVSKWERGEGLPDIMLHPSIALYFKVTIDEF